MRLNYFYQIATILFTATILLSCIGSSKTNSKIEYSHDAQIYSITMSSSEDAQRALSATKFSIDQLNGEIFNKEPLPYLFTADSVKLSVVTANKSTNAHINITLQNKDSIYTWNGKDSVSFSRIKAIEALAEDGSTLKKYNVKINIYQEDPFVISWEQITQNYLSTTPIEDQKTVLFENKFITYYKSSGSIKASATEVVDGKKWATVTVSGLPETINFKSIFTINEDGYKAVYAQDTDNSIYKSTDGLAWSKIISDTKAVAIYGKLPSVSGEFRMLTIVSDNGTLKYAETKDFKTFASMNTIPDDFPVKDFSTVSYEDPLVFGAKYIIVSGGTDSKDMDSHKCWRIQEKGGEISDNATDLPSISLKNSVLFSYNKTSFYLLTQQSGANKLYLSENYGLNWSNVEKNQALPSDFVSRENASVITDADNYIWIFGGKSNTNAQIADVWRGRLNKLAQ